MRKSCWAGWGHNKRRRRWGCSSCCPGTSAVGEVAGDAVVVAVEVVVAVWAEHCLRNDFSVVAVAGGG